MRQPGFETECPRKDQKTRELDFEQFLELITVRNDSKTIRVSLVCFSFTNSSLWQPAPIHFDSFFQRDGRRSEGCGLRGGPQL